MVALPLILASLSSSGCIIIRGDVIRPRDLAPVIGLFAQAPNPELVLAPAPLRNTRKILTEGLLIDWLKKAAAPTPGSSGIGISHDTPLQLERSAPYSNSLCIEREHTLLSQEMVEQSIRESLNQSEVILRVERWSSEALPLGKPSFPLSGAGKPSPTHPDAPFLWRGSWLSASGHSIPIWASVRAYRLSPVVQLRVSLPAGSQLTVDEMEKSTAIRSVFDPVREESLELYAGRLLKDFCEKGSVLTDRLVELPPIVRKDSVIPVEVISGDLRLRFSARAEADGWTGQFIPFVIPEGRRRFRAQVQTTATAVLALGSGAGSMDRAAPTR